MKTTIFPSLKTKRKVIAAALATALILPAIPYENTDAAARITLKSGAAVPATIYTGHSYILTVNGKSYTKAAKKNLKFYSSNKKVAVIHSTTGKLKPAKPGQVKISVKNKYCNAPNLSV